MRSYIRVIELKYVGEHLLLYILYFLQKRRKLGYIFPARRYIIDYKLVVISATIIMSIIMSINYYVIDNFTSKKTW